jgi:hypothetical protein
MAVHNLSHAFLLTVYTDLDLVVICKPLYLVYFRYLQHICRYCNADT